MIRGKEIINPARSQSWVRTTLIRLSISAFRETHLPVPLWLWGTKPISIPYLDPKLNIAWWDFFFLNREPESSFSVVFFSSLLKLILNGLRLSKAPAGIILYHCVKSNLQNKLLLKIIHMVGYWNVLLALQSLLCTIMEKLNNRFCKHLWGP